MSSKKIDISASILSADFAELGKEVEEVTKAGADLIHIDVMDGDFVPNITMGPKIISDIRKFSKLPFDVHLMIKEPERYISNFAKAGSDLITVHLESTSDIKKTLKIIKSFGKKTGISIKPETEIEFLDGLYNQLDLILVMTVNPGFAGQAFMDSQLNKIRKIKKKINAINPGIKISVDGGINEKTAGLAKGAGADILVAGSAIFSNEKNDYAKNIRKIREA